MKFTPQEIESLSKDFESASPQEIIAWAVAHFCPNLVLSSSFQTQSLPLLHMVWQVRIPVKQSTDSVLCRPL